MDYTGCRALTNDEIEKLCFAFSGRYRLRDQAIFRLGLHTGFRISEILSIKIGDVIFDGEIRPEITVAKAWMKGRKMSRTIPFHPRAQEAVLRWIDSLGNMGNNPTRPLFPSQMTEKRLAARTFWGNLKVAATRSGVSQERLGTHSMRKTFASKMWTSPYIGRDLLKLSRVLGHRDPAMSARYVEFMDDSMERAILAV